LRLTLEQLVRICPRITPRIFTISSSNLLHPKEVHLTVKVVAERFFGERVKIGQCSKFFQEAWQEQLLRPSARQSVHYELRSSSFGCLISQRLPILMIANGCGISPFLGFCQERQTLIGQGQNLCTRLSLYQGCRRKG